MRYGVSMTASLPKTKILIEIDQPVAEKIMEYAKLDGATRIDLIREALNDFLEKRLNRTIAEQYAEGYGKFPQEEDPWVDELTRQMIEEEPW